MTGAKPDRAETSAIAALAGFAFGDAFAVSQCVPAIVSATGRLIARTLLSRPAFLRRGLVLFRFDVLQHCAQVLVLGDCRMGDALVLVEDGIGERDTLDSNFKCNV